MKQKILISFLVIICLAVVQGCSGHRSPTPYRQKYDSRTDVPPGVPEGLLDTRPRESVVVKIRKQARQLIEDGELDAASQTIERGLRIAPKDEFLWSQLAVVRLGQRNYQQARSLAAKSIDLAGRNSALVSRNREIIQEAEEFSLRQ